MQQASPQAPRSSARPLNRWLALLVLCLLCPAAARAACIGPAALQTRVRSHPDAAAYTALGTWFGDKHQFDCAVEAFSSARKLDPGSATTAYMLGLSLYSAGHEDESVAVLKQTIQLAPGMLRAHLLLATVYEQAKRPQDARAEWGAALRIDPRSDLALDGFSKSLIAEGDYVSVIDKLKSSPKNEDLSLDLAFAYEQLGMLDDAAALLSAALKADPSSIRLASRLVTVLFRQLRYQDAARIAERAARLHPGPDMEGLYLRVLVLNGDTAIARPLARKLLAASPHNFDFLYLSGILEQHGGEYATARAHLEEAVALSPANYSAHYQLGTVLAKLQDPKGAREQFEEAIQLGDAGPEVHFDLAGVLRNLGETQLAQDQLKLYQQELKDKSARTLAAGKSAQAEQELAAGNSRKAADLYREAFEALPQNAMLGYKLAMALDKGGDLAGERATLEQVVKLDPSMALAQNQLGYLESRSGDSARAEEQFRLALRAAPSFTQAWVSLAATLGMESRFPEAQEAVAKALRLDPDDVQAHDLAKALTAAAAQAQR